MGVPRLPITDSIVVVNQGKSEQEIVFYNLLYHRVRSMLPSAKIKDVKKIITGQIKAWERLNKRAYKKLLNSVLFLSPDEVTRELMTNDAFAALFEDAASQIAGMTNEVLNYGLPVRLTHQYLLNNIRESQRAVQRLQKVVKIDTHHPLKTYLDMQDAYLNSMSSTLFVVIGAINRFLTTQEGDHSYHQTSDILIRLVTHVSGTKRTNKFSEKLFNGIIRAVLPDVVAGALTNEQSQYLKTAVKAVLQLVNDQNEALGSYGKLSAEHKSAVTHAGIVTKPLSELALNIAYNPKDFVYFAIRQYTSPVFAAADAAHGGARAARDFFYNAARPLYGVNFGFNKSRTARHLIQKVYGQSLSRVEFFTLFEFHLFVIGVLGHNTAPSQRETEQLFEIYIQHNPTNQAINVAYYNYNAMVSLSTNHADELQQYVSAYKQAKGDDGAQLLVKLMLDLHSIQRLFANGSKSCELISNKLSQISQLQSDVSKLIDQYIVTSKGEQAKYLQDFSTNVINPKLQLILIELYKSILPDICRDIMDVVPNMAVTNQQRYHILKGIFNKALSGSALVTVDEIELLQKTYAELADEIVKRKISLLPTAIQINRQLYNHEIENINRDVRNGFPQIFEQCFKLSSTLPKQSFDTNPKLVTEPVQLRSRQADEVNSIKETLDLIHPHFIFEALIDVLNKQIEECKLHANDPAFEAKIAYCESLQALIRTFLSTYCPGNPVDYSPLAEGMQQIINTAVVTTDKFAAQAAKQATPSLGFLFKLADHFSPANGVADRNYMDLAISFILQRMDLENVEQAYHFYQAMNIANPTASLVGHLHQQQLENPLGATHVVDGVVTGYVNRMADYLMSLSESERLKIVGYIPGFSLVSKYLGDNVFNREVVATKILEVFGFREKKTVVVNPAKPIAKQYITQFLRKNKQEINAAEDAKYNATEKSVDNFIGYIPGFNLLAAMLGDKYINRKTIANRLMALAGIKKKKTVAIDQDQVAQQAQADSDPRYQYFADTLRREKIKLRTKYANADLKKLYDLLANNKDEEFINHHRDVFFEVIYFYLSYLFNKAVKLQDKEKLEDRDPIAAMKLCDLVLAYLDKLETLNNLSKSQIDAIHASRREIEARLSSNMEKKIAEIKEQLLDVNKELGKAESGHGVIREGVEPARVNYTNIGLHVAGGLFEIGTAAYAVYATVIALMPLIGTAATLASYATAFVGGPLAMISLRFAFYFVKGMWESREELRNIWKTKPGEEPKKGFARVVDVAVKVRDTAAIVAKNLVVAVLKATLIYHVVNYVSTIKALDVRNWTVFKAIKKRVQRRKVGEEGIELKELARNVNTQAQTLLAVKDRVNSKGEFLELLKQLADFHARVKKALPVVQAALKTQVDSLNALQLQLETVYRTRQIIRQTVDAKQNADVQGQQVAQADQALVPAKRAYVELKAFLPDYDAHRKEYLDVYTNKAPHSVEEIPQPGVIDAVAARAADVQGVIGGAAGVVYERVAGAGDYVRVGLGRLGLFGQNPGTAPQLPQPVVEASVLPSQPDVPSSPMPVVPESIHVSSQSIGDSPDVLFAPTQEKDAKAKVAVHVPWVINSK